MDFKITVTCYATTAISDFLGLEAMAPGAQFVSQGGSFTNKTFSFVVTGGVWDRVRPYLVSLSQQRIPAVDLTTGLPTSTGHTMPMLTYLVESVPGDRPRITSVEVTGENPAALSLSAAGPTAIILRGTGLLAGLAATGLVYQTNPAPPYGYPGSTTPNLPTLVMTYTAVRKGPGANGSSIPAVSALGARTNNPVGGITINHLPGAAASAITTSILADGEVVINVTPLASAYTSTAIAAIVNGDSLASLYVTATANVASAQMTAASGIVLSGGDGGGAALLDLPDAAFTGLHGGPGFLRVEALSAGCQGNLYSLTIITGTADGVVTTGTDIVVNTTSATPTASAVAVLIGANAGAAAIVKATSEGTSGNVKAVTKTYLYGGSGEILAATVAGGVATVTKQTDTEIDLSITKTALDGGGALAGDIGAVQVQLNFGLLTTYIPVVT